MRLSLRIASLTLIGFFAAAFIAGFSIHLLLRTEKSIEHIANVELSLLANMTRMSANQLEQGNILSQTLAYALGPSENTAAYRDLQMGIVRFEELSEQNLRLVNEALSTATRTFQQSQQMQTSSWLREVVTSLQWIRMAQAQSADVANRLFYDIENGNREDAVAFVGFLRFRQESISNDIIALVTQLRNETDLVIKDLSVSEKRQLTTVGSMAVIALVLCALLGFGLARSVTRPLRAVTTTLGELGRGNAAVALPRLPHRVPELSAINLALETFRDEIIERRRTLDRLAQSERRFQTLASLSPAGIFEANAEGRYTYVNDAYCRITGLQPIEALSQGWLQALHTDDRDDVFREWIATIKDGKPFQMEVRFRRPDGTIAWCINQAIPLREANGALRGFVGTLTDISGLKQAQEALENQSLFQQTLIDALPVSVLYRDEHQRYLGCNEIFLKTFGFRREEVMGHHVGKVFAASPQPFHRQLRETDIRAIATRQPVSYETTIAKADGTQRDFVIHKAIFTRADGTYAGIISTAMDITERIAEEDALRKGTAARTRLYEITTAPDLSFEQKVHALLGLGVSTFEMEVGLVSLVEDETLIPQFAVSEDPDLTQKALLPLPLKETYSGFIRQADSPLAQHDVGKSPLRNSTARAKVGHDAFIGAPVFVDGRRYGTLSFLRKTPRRPFVNIELSLVQLFAQWIGNEISRQRADQAIKLSEERLNLALDSIEDGLWDWNIATGETYFSPRWETMLDYTPGEIRPQVTSWKNLIHPDDLEPTLESLNAHLEGREQTYEAEVRMRTKSGDWRWIQTRGKVVQRAADGAPLRAIGTHTDITGRKRAELEFSKLSLAVEHSPNITVVTDPDGVIEYVNPKFSEVTGYSRDEVVGKTPRVLKSGEITPGEYEKLWQTITTGREWRGVFHNRRKDGSFYWAEAAIAPVMNAEGRIAHFIGLQQDITERKRVEEMKRAFVATVTHELRTPLTSIRGALGLLVGGVAGPLPEAAGRLVTIAHDNSRRLLSLVNDILDIEKLESGRMTFHFAATDITMLVKQAVEACHGYAEEHGITFRITRRARGAFVWGDADRLGQVMANLLSNAAKFSPRKSVVTVSVTKPRGWVRIAVNDRGPGIPEAFRERVFDRFSQADDTDARRAGGTGLGLNIAKMIVESHDGRIDFITRPGKGTTFHVELPAMTTDSRAGTVTAPSSGKGTQARKGRSNPDGTSA